MLSQLWLAPLLAICAMFASFAPAPQAVRLQDPVVWSQLCEDGVVAALHVDGTMTATKLTEEGVLVTSTTALAPQGTSNAPVPTVTTSYKDADGMTHTVTTPIPSTTPAGLESSMQTHRTLVRLMKQIYPPAPTTP
jgi:hypothetical protein